MTRSPSSPSPWKSRRLWIVTAIFTMAMRLCTWLLFSDTYERELSFIIKALASAAASAWLLWWLLLERRKTYGTLRGLSVGILIAASTHYLFWYYGLLSLTLRDILNGGISTHNALFPFSIIWKSLIAATIGFIGMAPIMIPVFAMVGGALGFFGDAKRDATSIDERLSS